jgi:hypothetical protein
MRVRIGDIAIDITWAILLAANKTNTYETKDPFEVTRDFTSLSILVHLGIKSTLITAFLHLQTY